jgi:hypothetical protein
MLTEIMYRLFLASLNYAKDIDLAEIEIALEADGRLEAFEKTFKELHGKAADLAIEHTNELTALGTSMPRSFSTARQKACS